MIRSRKARARERPFQLENIQNLLEAAGLAVVLITPGREIAYMNPVAEAAWGESVGGRCYEVMRGEGGKCADCPLDEVFRGRAVAKRDMSMTAPEGQATRENLYMYLTGPESGKPFLLLVSTDLPGRKVLEREVRRERELSAALIESVNALIIGFDSEGEISFTNRAVERLAGLEEQQIRDKGVLDLVPEEYRSLARVYFGSPPGEPRAPEAVLIPVLNRDGSSRMVSWTYSPLPGAGSRAEGAIALGQDVTERFARRKRAEKLAEELIVVNTILARAGAATDLDEILEVALGALLSLPGYRCGAAYRMEKGGYSGSLVAQKGFSAAAPPEHATGTGKEFPGVAISRKEIVTASALEPGTHPVVSRIIRAEGLTGVVAVPLFVQGRPVGSLLLGHDLEPDAAKYSMELIRGAADALELGAENALLRLKAEEQAREATSLLKVAQALTGTLDLTSALVKVAAEAAGLLDVDRCDIWLYDEESGVLHSRAGHDWTPADRPSEAVPISENGAAAEAMRTLRPVAVHDAERDPRAYRSRDGTPPARSSLVVPLLTEGRFAGALTLDVTGRRRVFDEREISLIESFARQASIALHNASLVQELRESEERYRVLAEGGLVGLLLHDGESIVYANERLFEMTGYSREEIRTIEDVVGAVAPGQKEGVAGLVADPVGGGGAPPLNDIKLRAKDGSVLALQTLTQLISMGGRTLAMMAVVDVTQRVRAEEALKDSEERYRTIVETSRDPIVTVNRAGEILYANPSVFGVIGYTEEEITGRYLFEFIHPDDRERAARDFVNDWRTGSTIPNYPMRVIGQEGAVRHVEASSGLVGWPAEDGLQIFLVRDVTERKQRETDRDLQVRVDEAIAAIATRFVDTGDVREAIAETLEGAGELLGLRRVLYVELSEDGSVAAGVAEWRAEGAASVREKILGLESGRFQWWLEKLRSDGELSFSGLELAPPGEGTDFISSLDVGGLAVAPVMVRDEVAGVISFNSGDRHEWSMHEMSLLREMARTVSRAIEREQWVERLGRSEKFRTRITESIGEGLFVLADGVITWANRQASEIYGYSPGEMLGKTSDFLLPDPGRLEKIGTDMLEALSRDGVFVSEEKARRKDGAVIDTVLSITSLGVTEDGAGEVLAAVRDVTESKRMQEEIAAAAKAYSTLFSSASDAFFVHTLDGEIIDINERACQYTGLDRDELIGTSVIELFPEKLRGLYGARREEVVRDSVTAFEVHLLRKGGGRVPVEVTARLTWIRGERVVLAAMRDITERHSAEKENRRRARQLASLNEIVKVATSSLDLEAVVDDILRTAAEASGADAAMILLETHPGRAEYGPAATVGDLKGIEGLSDPEARRGFLSGVTGSDEGSRIICLSTERGDGRPPQLLDEMRKEGVAELLVVPLRSGDKRPGFMVMSAGEKGAFEERDLGFYDAAGAEIGVAVENSLIYRELAAEHERLSLLYRTAQGISGELEMDALLHRTAEEAARAVGAEHAAIALREPVSGEYEWRAFYNLDPGELEGAVLSQDRGIGWQVAETKRALLIRAESGPGGGLREQDAVAVALSLKRGGAVPLVSGDKVLGLLMLKLEESERGLSGEDVLLLEAIGRQAGVAVENARLYGQTRLHLEALEQAHRELMALDRMKSDFVSTVSHELRSPLAVIEGFAKTMVEHFDQIDRETERESLEIILKKSIALEGLIENILDMARIEEGRLEVYRDKLDLVELIEGVRADHESVDETHEIRFETGEQRIMVTADREKAEVALGNLVRNAVKFSPRGGRISINARAEGRFAMVSVADSGIGIHESELDRIFDRFYQVDSSEARSFPGSGLGLYITRELVQAMGGVVTVDSLPGRGSVFTFSLPLAR